MKFSEIRLNDSAPDVTGAQTATFRNVDADVEPWGLWVGTLLLPWGSIRYARREHVKLDAMGSWTVPLKHPGDAERFEVRRLEVPTSMVVTGVDMEAGVVTVQDETEAELARAAGQLMDDLCGPSGVSPHDVEQLPPGVPPDAVPLVPEAKRKRGKR